MGGEQRAQRRTESFTFGGLLSEIFDVGAAATFDPVSGFRDAGRSGPYKLIIAAVRTDDRLASCLILMAALCA